MGGESEQLLSSDGSEYINFDKDEGPTWFVLGMTICASLNSVLLGYSIGIMGGAIVYMQDEYGFNDFQYEMLIGLVNLVAVLGAMLAYFISDGFGRRVCLATAAFMFLIGNAVCAVASGYWMLLFGRVFAGLGVGLGNAIDPLYISEISPARYRGGLVSSSEVSINVGITMGYISSLGFSYVDAKIGWRLMMAVGCIVPVVMLYLTCCVMYETPRWLMAKGRIEEAEVVLRKMSRSNEEAKDTKNEIEEQIELEKLSEKQGWTPILHPTPAVRRMLIIVILVALTHQACGLEAITYYTPRIFKDAGIKNNNTILLLQAGMGCLKTFTTVIAAMLLDRPNCPTGRRPQLLFSISGCLVMLSVVGIGFTVFASNWGIRRYFVFGGIYCYVVAFSLGIGPVGWLFVAEILPLQIRAKGCSIATSINRATSALTSLTFLSLIESLTAGGAFFLYSGFALILLLVSYIYIPETKCRSLEQMTTYFEDITGTGDEARAKSARSLQA